MSSTKLPSVTKLRVDDYEASVVLNPIEVIYAIVNPKPVDYVPPQTPQEKIEAIAKWMCEVIDDGIMRDIFHGHHHRGPCVSCRTPNAPPTNLFLSRGITPLCFDCLLWIRNALVEIDEVNLRSNRLQRLRDWYEERRKL